MMSYLHVVSIFPALTETFVLREARRMRQMGCEVVIGQLRPAGGRPIAHEFDDLRDCVIRAELLGTSAFAATLFFIFKKPKLTWTYIKLVLASLPDVASVLKLFYVLLASMDLAYSLRHSRVAHVVGHHLHSEAVSAMFIAGFLGLPYSFTCHTVKSYYPRRILVEVVKGAAFIIADTFQVKTFLDSMDCDLRRVHIVRNAVVLSEFPMREQETVSEPPIILAVGRLDYKKGFHVLLSACSALAREGVHFRCVIVGDGDEWESLLDLKNELNLQEQVEMVGNLGFADLEQWYERATLLAVPSVVASDGSTDGLPTVVVEAFARGIPVVASSTGGIPEVVHNGLNGFVVAAGSPEDLADRITELLSNRDMRDKFAAEARRTAERDFDLDRNLRVLSRLMLGKVQEESSMLGSIAILSPAFDHAPGKIAPL
jgi:colanic acid/amylovoran biosynthesis glycosyltransferase